MDESVNETEEGWDAAPEESAPTDPASEPGLGLLGGEGQAPSSAKASDYRVLARKYRPATFEDMIGQEAMVRTLSNAFEKGRIAHAFMLTGVRGVGKTTTARILARALNYMSEDGKGGPTIHLEEPGVHCQSIMESRHPDILEMDAASRTGIDDIREIIESVRYLPVSARYKVYIIDEVHMLSKAAFNGLLKTLEEPPEHVKFIFATTEIRKVPVTVLSRCQRFDLRRLTSEELVRLLSRVCEKEDVKIESPALTLLARAAEGSARDALSILDQAISHGVGDTGDGEIKEADIRDMLGLADRGRIFDLYDLIMKGDAAAALGELRAQYDAGADPAVVLSDLAELTHWLTRLKLVESASDDIAATEAERERGKEMSGQLPIRVLSRVWQMLLKGIGEVAQAAKPIVAAEMVVVRLCHAADLPAPEDLIAQLKNSGAGAPARGPASNGNGGGGNGGAQAVSRSAQGGGMSSPAGAPQMQQNAQAAIMLHSFEDVVALAEEKRDIQLQHVLKTGVRLVSFQPGQIEIGASEDAKQTMQVLSERLRHWTGTRWLISVSNEAKAAPTLREQEQSETEALKEEVSTHPLVKAAMEAFPGAKIVDIRDPLKEAAQEIQEMSGAEGGDHLDAFFDDEDMYE
jgi:DNA polymerase-3 subunit gamma/tau